MKTPDLSPIQTQPNRLGHMGFLASCLVTTLFASAVAQAFSSNYPAMYLRGTMNNWGTTAMTLVANNTWQVTVSLPANTASQYKYDASGSWTTGQNWGVGGTSGVAAVNAGNINYTTAAAGNYVFKFNDSSLQYSITPPGQTSGEAPYGGTPAAIPGTVQAENYDTGGQGVAYNVNSVNGTGNSYRSDGVDLETTSDTGGGYDLGWTTSGQWFKYTVNVATAGTYTVSFRVAGPSAVTDAFHLSNSSGTNLSGSVTVPATGGYQSWATVTANVTLPAGQQVLTLVEDNVNWNINYLSFAASGSGSTHFTITASAGSNGSISPSGSVSVNQGASQSFTISPNSGSTVSSVIVDGTNVGTVSSYTFSNVQANHSISAAFQQQTSGEAPYGGSAAAIPGTVQAENYDTGGQGVAYNVNSINGTDNGYRSDGVDLEATSDTGGGIDLGWTSSGQWFKYTVNVATAGTYTVSFRVAGPSAVTDAFHLSNSSGTNLSGSVTVPATGGYQSWATVTASVTLPAGQQVLTLVEDNVNWNINYLSFAASGGGEAPYGGTPAAIPGTVQTENYDTGGQGVAYNVASVNGTGNSYRSDGVDLEMTSDAGGGYDLGWTTSGQWFKYSVNVATAGTYTVSFRVAGPNAVTDAFHLSNSSGTNLSGSVTVPATGGYQSWATVTANVTLPAGQQVLTLNQDNWGWNINYMSLTSGGSSTHFTITTSAGSNGSISPSGSVSVNQGASQSFTISPSSGYTVGSVTVDGANQGAITAYTFSNVQANHSISAAFQATTSSGQGANLPYTRYNSQTAVYGGGAVLETSPNFNKMNLATQASDQAYVQLSNSGAYVQWTVSQSNQAGVDMRFTLPDAGNGYGQNGSVDCYVNGTKVQTISLTSYYAWQYFGGNGDPSDTPVSGDVPAFAFDEVHWLLSTPLQSGDVIRIQSSGGPVVGVDFIEIESVPAPLAQPAGSVSVTSYGAVGYGNNSAAYNEIAELQGGSGVTTAPGVTDSLSAFNAAVAAALASPSKTLYIPAGTYYLSGMWVIGSTGSPINQLTIVGAGIWYTNIQFTNPNQASGGCSIRLAGNGTMNYSNVYLNSMLRSRYNENAVYKCFMDNFGVNSNFHDLWEDHFECGYWVADYAYNPCQVAHGLTIQNCRIRDNLADGVNFCNGTYSSTVTNCDIRNGGDDGLAVWPNNFNGAPMAVNDTFTHNTVEFEWRSAGIALYGGSGHQVTYNLVEDTFMSAGFRADTTFPGYQFQNNAGIAISNNTFICCGTSYDAWAGELGAVDLEASNTSIQNFTFTNDQVIDALRDGYSFGFSGGFSGMQFNSCSVNGTGLDGISTSKYTGAHLGAGICTYGAGSATFTSMTWANCAGGNVFNQGGFVLTIH